MKLGFLTTVFIIWGTASLAQTDTIKNLIFEGAGIRGVAYAGAIQELERRGALNHLEKVGGTSAGAITAMALSLGYTGEEIEKLIGDTKFRQFNDGKFIFVGGISRMFRKYGWYRHDKFRKWLGGIIEEKTGNPDITLQAMHDSGYIDIYVTTTLLEQQKVEVLSFEKYPAMKLIDAIQVSMSIPLYFESIYMNERGKLVNPRTYDGTKFLVFDGGLIANFPIYIFDRYEDGKRIENKHTIGLRIDVDVQIKADSLSGGIAPMEVSDLSTYIAAVYNLTIESLNRQSLSDADWMRTISISCGDVGPKIRKLKPDEKKQLVQNGINGVKRYFY